MIKNGSVDISRFGAVIFDFDFTLSDASEGIIRSFNEAFAASGMPARDGEAIRRTVGLHVKDSYRILIGRDADDGEAECFYRRFITAADGCMTACTRPLDGSLELLEALKASGCPACIVSTKLSYRITDFYASIGHPELIDFVIGSSDVSRCKPDPEGLLLAAGRLGLPRQELLYVGDSTVDAAAAENAGIAFCGVTTGTTSGEALAAYPNYAIIDSLSRLTLN